MCRSRLVACEYSQIPGFDFTEIYSPVVNDVALDHGYYGDCMGNESKAYRH
jgi:hypothetical protein